jgi:hypothetical protein
MFPILDLQSQLDAINRLIQKRDLSRMQVLEWLTRYGWVVIYEMPEDTRWHGLFEPYLCPGLGNGFYLEKDIRIYGLGRQKILYSTESTLTQALFKNW